MALPITELRNFHRRQMRRVHNLRAGLANADAIAQRVNSKLARAGFLQSIVSERFDTEGESGGRSWPGLRPATQAQRKRQGFGATGPILHRSGFLERGATSGRVIATATGITLMFRDGPAPRYVGAGKAKRRRTTGKARTDLTLGGGGKTLAPTGRLSDYLLALNARRPFFHAPTKREMRPMLQERDRLIQLEVLRIAGVR